MSFNFGWSEKVLGNIYKNVGMRGLSTSSTSETVLYTASIDPSLYPYVFISLTGRASSSGYTATFRVRRNSVSGEILLQGSTTSSSEVLIARGIFPIDSGVFVWTASISSTAASAIIGSRSGMLAYDDNCTLIPLGSNRVYIPGRFSLKKIKGASLIDPVSVCGVIIQNVTEGNVLADNMFLDGIEINTTTQYIGEEHIVLSIEGKILTIT
ncbi:MAG: hypothetical protein QXW58_06075 [Thermosphaera sp.]